MVVRIVVDTLDDVNFSGLGPDGQYIYARVLAKKVITFGHWPLPSNLSENRDSVCEMIKII